MTYDTEHQAALKTVTETNERLAQKMHWPLWRHAAVGALFCVLLLGISLPGSIGGVINVAMIGVVFLLIRDDKRRHGMWVSGYQKGRTGWVMAALVGLVLACIAASMAWIDEQPLLCSGRCKPCCSSAPPASAFCGSGYIARISRQAGHERRP